jgi:hypothetical protein
MKRMIAEFACMRMCDPRLDDSVESLSARIAQLEDRIALMEMGGVAASAPASPAVTTPVAEVTAKPEPVKNESTSAPAAATDMEFDPLPDVSEFLEKLGQIDKQAQSFLSESEILVSADGKQVLIRTANAFSLMMLSKESSKTAIARAMALCRITSGPAEILVKETKKAPTGYAVDSELY